MEPLKTADKRRKYDAVFRAEAVRRVAEHGQPQARVAQALGMSAALLGRWVRTTRNAPTGGGGELARENKQLRAALARAEQERDILKKALTIFSHPTRL